jgi:hypothetical protein
MSTMNSFCWPQVPVRSSNSSNSQVNFMKRAGAKMYDLSLSHTQKRARAQISLPVYHLENSIIEIRRSRWPRGLRRGSAAVGLLGLKVRFPPRARKSAFLSVVNFQVSASATGRSLVQGNNTECCVSNWVWPLNLKSVPNLKKYQKPLSLQSTFNFPDLRLYGYTFPPSKKQLISTLIMCIFLLSRDPR